MVTALAMVKTSDVWMSKRARQTGQHLGRNLAPNAPKSRFLAVIPGRRPRVPGAMQHAALRGVMLRRTGTAQSAGVRDGPGSAAHRSARATRCTASGTRCAHGAPE